MKLIRKIKDWEYRLRKSYNTDLSTPENRRRARIYNLWFDHAILRTFWTNHHCVAPDVYRSNHPTHERFEKLKAQGIRSILNLRGDSGAAHYLVEKESCKKLGLELISVTLHARFAAPKKDILGLIDAFERIKRPFVMHCKSGADRAGFASVIYLMEFENEPVAQARRMLSARYIHFRWTKTGVLDLILDKYQAAHDQSGIRFRDWVKQAYDPEAIQAEFNTTRSSRF